MEKFYLQQNPEPPEITDNDIIKKVLDGDKDCYALIMRRYNARLYRLGMSMMSNNAEVEDVMQTVYVNAYQNLGKFSFKSAFSTWLTRILINECLQRLKKRKHTVAFQEEATNQVTDVQNPVIKMLHSELKSVLEEAISQLPEKYRIVFIMREVENMNIAETKDCLNITAVNVKVRLNRAKALLRKSLKMYYQDGIFQFHLSRCNRLVETVLKQLQGS